MNRNPLDSELVHAGRTATHDSGTPMTEMTAHQTYAHSALRHRIGLRDHLNGSSCVVPNSRVSSAVRSERAGLVKQADRSRTAAELTAAFGLFPWLMAGLVADVWGPASFAFALVLAFGGWILTCAMIGVRARADGRRVEQFDNSHPNLNLSVPQPAALAYSLFCEHADELAELNVPEEVREDIARIRPIMDDLLAASVEESEPVLEEMLRFAAEAAAVVEVARQRDVVLDGRDQDALVIQARELTLTGAGVRVIEEQHWLSDYLAASTTGAITTETLADAQNRIVQQGQISFTS